MNACLYMDIFREKDRMLKVNVINLGKGQTVISMLLLLLFYKFYIVSKEKIGENQIKQRYIVLHSSWSFLYEH